MFDCNYDTLKILVYQFLHLSLLDEVIVKKRLFFYFVFGSYNSLEFMVFIF